MNLKLSETIVGGQYSNFAVIAHSSSEFVIDFAKILPGVDHAEVGSRVIMAPEHAKRLMIALNDNIEKYEAQFGKIRMHSAGGTDVLPHVEFGGDNTPQA